MNPLASEINILLFRILKDTLIDGNVGFDPMGYFVIEQPIMIFFQSVLVAHFFLWWNGHT